MEKHIKPCQCGGTRVLTELNSYDVYEVENGKLEFQHSEIIDAEIKFYCSECGEEFKEE